MAAFFSSLWESIFTPGPTPTLLIATNVTFGALQALLLALLVATRSIHFAILSFLCAGLWYSINWFAQELAAAKAKEAEAERLRKRRAAGLSSTPSSPEGRKVQTTRRDIVADSADDEGEDTETEGGLGESAVSLGGDVKEKIRQAMREDDASGTGASTGVTTLTDTAIRQRFGEESDRSGDISTDSEWEKVDGHR